MRALSQPALSLGVECEGGSKRLVLKLLDVANQKVKAIHDDYGHKPYCYIKAPM